MDVGIVVANLCDGNGICHARGTSHNSCCSGYRPARHIIVVFLCVRDEHCNRQTNAFVNRKFDTYLIADAFANPIAIAVARNGA